MYILYIKDNICVAKGICKSIENTEPFLSVYDAVEEVTEAEYKEISIPATKTNGKWEKTDKMPVIEYPEAPEQSPSAMEQLRADIDYIAIMTGVEL